MCKHSSSQLVNWHSVTGEQFVDLQCNICGACAANVESEIDYDVDGRAVGIDINSVPQADTAAFAMWNQTSSKPLTKQRRDAIIEQFKQEIES